MVINIVQLVREDGSTVAKKAWKLLERRIAKNIAATLEEKGICGDCVTFNNLKMKKDPGKLKPARVEEYCTPI